MPSSKAQQAEKELGRSGPWGKLKVYLNALGPGLITGASDDDPSGIGTYSQTGAQFGYAQLWTALFTFPLMTAIQEICARIALQTGGGLADALRKYYPKPVLYFCVTLLFVANTINLGADLGAMAASAQLLLGIPYLVWLIAITLLSVVLEIFIDYKRYARVLRYLTLSLFAYCFVPFVSSQNWGQALRDTVIPTIRFNKDYLLNLVAILGTTISPYLFFWQASQEVEEQISIGRRHLRQREGASTFELKYALWDTVAGMVFSEVVAYFIILATGATLFVAGKTEIASAADAAVALQPIAGDAATALLAVGLIGAGVLAVPVLTGSAAYAVTEAFGWKSGLDRTLTRAPQFYGVIVAATLVGMAINFFGINPITALVVSAVLNGLVAVPLLVLVMLVSNNRKAMGERTNGPLLNLVGWATTIVMGLAAVALVVTTLVG